MRFFCLFWSIMRGGRYKEIKGDMGEIKDVCLQGVFSNGLRILQRVGLYHGAAE